MSALGLRTAVVMTVSLALLSETSCQSRRNNEAQTRAAQTIAATLTAWAGR